MERGSDEKGIITEYVTDITAIRHCIAHAHYKIRKSNDGSLCVGIRMETATRVDFLQEVFLSEFLGHTEEYILFEELQGILLVIAMCEELMELHLKLK